MSPRRSKSKSHPPIEELPKELRRSLVKLMAHDNLDIEEAYRKAAVLIDVNSTKFKDEVQKEADRIYKSRFMSEINKARTSIKNRAEEEWFGNYEEAYKQGHIDAKAENEIWFYCSVCNKKITVTPNSNSHQEIIKLMKKAGWGHQSCHDKKTTR